MNAFSPLQSSTAVTPGLLQPTTPTQQAPTDPQMSPFKALSSDSALANAVPQGLLSNADGAISPFLIPAAPDAPITSPYASLGLDPTSMYSGAPSLSNSQALASGTLQPSASSNGLLYSPSLSADIAATPNDAPLYSASTPGSAYGAIPPSSLSATDESAISQALGALSQPTLQPSQAATQALTDGLTGAAAPQAPTSSPSSGTYSADAGFTSAPLGTYSGASQLGVGVSPAQLSLAATGTPGGANDPNLNLLSPAQKAITIDPSAPSIASQVAAQASTAGTTTTPAVSTTAPSAAQSAAIEANPLQLTPDELASLSAPATTSTAAPAVSTSVSASPSMASTAPASTTTAAGGAAPEAALHAGGVASFGATSSGGGVLALQAKQYGTNQSYSAAATLPSNHDDLIDANDSFDTGFQVATQAGGPLKNADGSYTIPNSSAAVEMKDGFIKLDDSGNATLTDTSGKVTKLTPGTMSFDGASVTLTPDKSLIVTKTDDKTGAAITTTFKAVQGDGVEVSTQGSQVKIGGLLSTLAYASQDPNAPAPTDPNAAQATATSQPAATPSKDKKSA